MTRALKFMISSAIKDGTIEKAQQCEHRATVQRIDKQQAEVGGLRMMALETQAQMVRQMRVEQGVGHHPENVDS